MEQIPERAGSSNSLFPFTRPHIEAARDCEGWYVLRDNHGWLCGDRRQAIREFDELERIERWGRT
jgi:hypothetical protein